MAVALQKLGINPLIWDPPFAITHTHSLEGDLGFYDKMKKKKKHITSRVVRATASAHTQRNGLTAEPSCDSMRSDIIDLL